MGVIKQGILGGFSGKVAGVVGTSWKGIAVMKSLPQSVSNPQTAGQVAQRTLFSNAVAFAGNILSEVIKPLWDRFASKMSGYNNFIKTNISLFAAALPSPAASLVISTGKMASTSIASLAVTNGSPDCILTWLDDSGEGYKLASDIPYVVIVNETQGTIQGFETSDRRDDAGTTVTMDENNVTSDVVNAYLAFKRSDGTIVSNTSFITETV